MSATGTPGPRIGSPAPVGGPPRALRADARRNYQRLVTAAAEAFAEHGADDAALEEIARRAGVGIGTLYRHFPTRQALLEAVYVDQVEALRIRAVELLESCPPDEALAGWLRSLVAFSATKHTLIAALLATLDKDSELISSCSAVVRQAAGALLARAQDAGVARPDASAIDLLKLVHGLAYVCRQSTDPAQLDRLLSMVLDGLHVRPAGSAGSAEPGSAR